MAKQEVRWRLNGNRIMLDAQMSRNWEAAAEEIRADAKLVAAQYGAVTIEDSDGRVIERVTA